MEYNYVYYALQTMMFTVSIFILNILNFCLMYKGFILFPCFYFAIIIIDKLFMYSKLKTNRYVQLLDLFDLYPLYLLYRNESHLIMCNSIDYMIKLYLRFFFMPWSFQFILMNHENFSQLDQSMQLIIVTAFCCVVLQSANTMYLSNTFRVNILNFYEVIPAFNTFIQYTSIAGVMTLFIISYDSFELWIIILIKLAVIISISFIVCNENFELYDVLDQKTKFILSCALISLSFVSETSPFLKYGKSKKIDSLKDKKLCSQRTLIAIRIGQFCESLIYFSLYDQTSQKIQQSIYLLYLSYVILTIFYCNCIISIYHFCNCLRERCTLNYKYIAQLLIPYDTAAQIVYQSQSFILIEFSHITQIEYLQEDFWEFLLNKSYSPIPEIGFRNLIFGTVFTLNNTTVNLDNTVFFKIFCEFYRNESKLPVRTFNFMTSFNKKEELILKTCLVNRLFEYGFNNETAQAFPIKSEEINTIIMQFQRNMLQVIVFNQIIAPNCSFFPEQILYDLFDKDQLCY